MAVTPVNNFEGTTFELAFQPVTNPAGVVQFHEMLVRPHNKSGNLIPTQKFIDHLEGRGADTMLRFDTLMLKHAAQTVARNPHIQLSVNVSSLSLGHAGWPGAVADVFRHQALLIERLGFEVTETKAIDNMDRAKAFCADVRAMGGKILLDDCGDGEHIKIADRVLALKPDILKVSSKVVDNMATSEQHADTFRAFHQAARELNVPILAEGIKTSAQLDEMCAMGVDLLQGYLLGKPSRVLPLPAAQPAPIFRQRLVANGL